MIVPPTDPDAATMQVTRFLSSVSAAALAVMLVSPVIAQTVPSPAPSEPTSSNASNIGTTDTRSAVAPALPSPDLSPGSTPADFLRAARGALATGRTGEAQQAMEMGMTRLLDRSTPLFQTNQPSQNPAVAKVSEALQALGAGDRSRSMQALEAAIPLAEATK
jgi:hypothetical protein